MATTLSLSPAPKHRAWGPVQYRPHYEAASETRYEEIGRRITEAEYREVVDYAREVGLERVEYDPAMAGDGGGLWP